MNCLTVNQIMFVHSRLIKETGGRLGVHDLSALLSAAGRPQSIFNDQDHYTDLFTKAAALLESLILNHLFGDGKKRVGMATAALYLRRKWYSL